MFKLKSIPSSLNKIHNYVSTSNSFVIFNNFYYKVNKNYYPTVNIVTNTVTKKTEKNSYIIPILNYSCIKFYLTPMYHPLFLIYQLIVILLVFDYIYSNHKPS